MKISRSKFRQILAEEYERVMKEFRTGYSPSKNYSVENLLSMFNRFDASQKDVETIFSKSLAFYDLETTGLSRQFDQIHQIAMIVYNAGFAAEIDPENPDDFFVSKCKVDQEIVKSKSAVNARRKDILLMSYAQSGAGYKNLYDYAIQQAKNGLDVFRADDETLEEGEKFLHSRAKPILYYLLLKSTVPFEEKIYRIQEKIDYTKPQEEMAKYLKDFFDFYEQDDTENIKKLKEIYNSTNPTLQEVVYFYNSLFKEQDLYLFHYELNKKDAKDIKDKLKFYERIISMTMSENMKLTNYKDFPIQKFKAAMKKMQGGNETIREDQSLGLFMEFINNFGTTVPRDSGEDLTDIDTEVFPKEGEYILIGHNIASFDNPFVVNRTNKYNIDNQKFADSYFYDTRRLCEYFSRYLNNYANVMEYLEKEMVQEPLLGYKGLTDQLKQKISGYLEILRTKKGGVSAQLERYMQIYNRGAVQTHTADDDCIQLAKVFQEIIPSFKEMYDGTKDLFDRFQADKGFADFLQTKRELKNPAYDLKPVFKDDRGKIREAILEAFARIIENFDEAGFKAHLSKILPTEFVGFKEQWLKRARSLLNMSSQEKQDYYDKVMKEQPVLTPDQVDKVASPPVAAFEPAGEDDKTGQYKLFNEQIIKKMIFEEYRKLLEER